MPIEIYRSNNLRVQSRIGFSNALCFVTFHAFDKSPSLNRGGFGETFFEREKIDAIHIIPQDNRWYQYLDLPIACSQVAKLTASYDRVIAYGSSMGGYAAIWYGKWAGATQAFAIAPQFSASPFRRPFDWRWFRERALLGTLHERPGDAMIPAIVAYDPHIRLDRRHVDRFRANIEVTAIRLPGSGHFTIGFLAERGLLQKILLTIASGDFSAAEIEREALRGRQEITY